MAEMQTERGPEEMDAATSAGGDSGAQEMDEIEAESWTRGRAESEKDKEGRRKPEDGEGQS